MRRAPLYSPGDKQSGCEMVSKEGAVERFPIRARVEAVRRATPKTSAGVYCYV